ncbi:TetR family transcriptional regulator [Halalkalibacter sp. AB-rgal2]|uniref:TetR family transcriptional regulator n=1 Tax=Halalkalibacter sp. AB-rgal2 TaxID=3242695 RepID=UPI00359CDDD9
MAKKANKLPLIVDAAIIRFKEKGFEHTSVSDIVKQAGVAQGTFYLYFKSKNELVPAIAERILTTLFESIQENVDDHASTIEILTIVVDETFAITDQYDELIKLCYSGLAYYHTYERWEEMYAPYYSWIEAQLKKGIDEGGIQSKIELSSLTKMIINLIESTAESYFFGNQQTTSVREVKQQLLLFISSSLTDNQS